MMKFKLTPYNLQELGQRQNQEDSLFPGVGQQTANDRLFILCDGMGGHEKGEVASATVCETMSNCILSRWNPNEPLSDGLLQQAIEEAYDTLDAKDNGEERKMGTTMTFVCFHGEGVTVAHIGDSRVYQLRSATKKEPASIVFKTRDHSLVNDLIDIGEITEEEAKNHPQKNVITRAMQPCQERRAKASISHLTDIREGDYFYMCSDGMLEQTTDENLLFIIANPKKSDKEKIEMLREVTKENKDNHTAHLIYINKVKGNAPVMNTPQPSSPQGTWINPQQEKPKKNKILIAVAIIIALLAIGASYLFHSYADGDAESKDSLVTDTTEAGKVNTPRVTPRISSEEVKPETEDTIDNDNTSSQQQPQSEPPAVEQSNKPNTVSRFILPKGKPTKPKKSPTDNTGNKNNE